MIAKLIAWGRDRDEALARLRRALGETMVVVEGGTTNQGFLLALLDRPEVQEGTVDTGWLDRLQLRGEIVPVRHADVALLQAAIELSDAETAADRARFYAYARRGRPQTGAASRRRRAPALPRPVLPARGLADRAGPLPDPGRRRRRRGRDAAGGAPRAPARPRGRPPPDHHLGAGPRAARRGRRRPAPGRARRRRHGAQPVARGRRVDPGHRGRRGPGRRRRRRAREHEDGDVADRAVPRPGPARPVGPQRPGRRAGSAAPARGARRRRRPSHRGRRRADRVRGTRRGPGARLRPPPRVADAGLRRRRPRSGGDR